MNTGDDAGPAALPAATALARVRLRVRDLARSVEFYAGVLGFETRDAGGGAVGLGAPDGGTALVLEASAETAPRPAGTRGLYHVALLLPDRGSLGAALARLLEAEHPLQGFADHDVSEAIYLADPDGNGLELYADRPRAAWRRAPDGQIWMTTRQLDVRGLLSERTAEAPATLPGDTRVGHIHLQVSDLAAAEAFYHGVLGFDVVNRGFPGALFLSAGGYHHHVGLNTWGRPGPEPADVAGLIEFEVRVPDAGARRALAARLGIGGEVPAGPFRAADPDGNVVVLGD